jgi:hypothetical protein
MNGCVYIVYLGEREGLQLRRLSDLGGTGWRAGHYGYY